MKEIDGFWKVESYKEGKSNRREKETTLIRKELQQLIWAYKEDRNEEKRKLGWVMGRSSKRLLCVRRTGKKQTGGVQERKPIYQRFFLLYIDKSLSIAIRYIYAKGDICIEKWSQLWLNSPTKVPFAFKSVRHNTYRSLKFLYKCNLSNIDEFVFV